ncbi:energy transducer TonB [Capnocytophaga gingivalis]|uniref:Energy transducer TonB n=1 Tax=Capnocytophaga gingivalis TaxID=1017 RepID=A0ABU5Z715_9FLAO|nr:energy transducer TonB [Capnocytophaga gingivalis]MEB3073942.1 energy transducer TonB [Capnocytophaga gingivalis]
MTAIRNLFLIGMILGAFSLYAQEEKEVSSTRIDKLPYYLKIDTLTGEKKEIPIKNFLDRWVTKNLQYPEKGIEEKIQGRVIVILKIDEKGLLSIEEIREGNPILREEICRVFDGFPQLFPALQRGKPVSITIGYPIVFKVDF